jgi:hypothetical protein
VPCSPQQPCTMLVTLPPLDNDSAGGALGMLLIFTLVFPFVRSQDRVILGLFLLFALGLYVIGHDTAVAYMWALFAFLAGVFSNALRIFGVT